MSPTRLTALETVRESGSWLFSAVGPRGDPVEVTLVPCADGVRAWVNTCTHEAQRLDRGGDVGAIFREGEIVCPKHGSTFGVCDGGCDNGPAAGSALVGVDVAVNRGEVYLTDEAYEFEHAGGIDDEDDLPDSTSHLRF